MHADFIYILHRIATFNKDVITAEKKMNDDYCTYRKRSVEEKVKAKMRVKKDEDRVLMSSLFCVR